MESLGLGATTEIRQRLFNDHTNGSALCDVPSLEMASSWAAEVGSWGGLRQGSHSMP